MSGAKVRRARVEDAAEIARVHVDSWRTTYAGLVPADHLASLSYERFEQNWLRESNDYREGVKASSDRREPVFTGT